MTPPLLHDKIFEILVEGVRDYAIFVLDPAGNVATWNTGARLLKGYHADEIIGRHFSIFYLPSAIADDWPAQELRIATAQGRFEDEGWRLRKDGSRFWANVIITALRDERGHLVGFSKITRDLTARRRAEEDLRQSEERFRLLIEGVEDNAIYMLDPEGTISSWNAGAQKVMGYSRDEITGRHFSVFHPPEDISSGRPWEAIARARGGDRAEDEGWRLRKNGERFRARSVVTALYDHEGGLRGFAVVTHDLTQREYARDLEETAGRVNEFIAVLAHELRNPLAPIRTAVQVMEKVSAEDVVHGEMRKIIDRQSTHLMRIVDDMLDISRITRGSLPIERASLEISAAISRAVEMVMPAIAQARHELRLDLSDAPLHVIGDLGRLTQVVANLLTNAVRYTPGAGEISVSTRREGDYVAVAIRDNGRGIPAEELEGIFGMFVQGKEPLHRVGGGLGIGLALSRRIAELHGGTLEAASEGEGQGSRFTLRIPSASSRPFERTSSSRSADEGWEVVEVRRVLIVDDNIDAASTLEVLMRSLGHRTRIARDGSEALRIAAELRPEVVLLDIGLPGMSGYEVARRLRALGIPPMRIIAVTGWGSEEDRRRSEDAGIDVHLVKPVDHAALARLLAADRGSSTLH